MNNRQRIAGCSLLLLTPFLATGAIAAQPNVPFASGGVSMEQRNAMQVMQNRFNTHFTFAVAQTGHYVADVDVSITDKNGNEMLTTTVPGPVLYAQLPPGNYRVAATYDGKQQVRNFQVKGNGPAKLNMYWNEASTLSDKEARVSDGWQPRS